jgi:hypothetical protein|tara:strand:- start:1015 stop:1218 length:204 start_codon:yes stop_codon:yes gene_type:complete
MDIVKITCTDTDKTLNGDVLRKSDRFIEVVVEGTGAKLRLSKKTPHDKLYIGRLAGLEFTSTGETNG